IAGIDPYLKRVAGFLANASFLVIKVQRLLESPLIAGDLPEDPVGGHHELAIDTCLRLGKCPRHQAFCLGMLVLIEGDNPQHVATSGFASYILDLSKADERLFRVLA